MQEFHSEVLDDLERVTAQLRPKHLDYHFLRRRREKSQGVKSRQWYVGEAEWIAGTSSLSDAAPVFFEQTVLQGRRKIVYYCTCFD